MTRTRKLNGARSESGLVQIADGQLRMAGFKRAVRDTRSITRTAAAGLVLMLALLAVPGRAVAAGGVVVPDAQEKAKGKGPAAGQKAPPAAAKPDSAAQAATAAGKPAAKAAGQIQAVKAEQAVIAANYRVGPGDVLHVNVWKEAELTQDVIVRPDGFISLPLAKDVYVNELTLPDVAKVLTERLGNLLTAPDVTVLLRQANSKKIYLLGQVRRAGPMLMFAPMTVAQALSEAGGLSEYANPKSITIIRNTMGKQERFKFNYKDFMKGNKLEQNIALVPGDTIVVP